MMEGFGFSGRVHKVEAARLTGVTNEQRDRGCAIYLIAGKGISAKAGFFDAVRGTFPLDPPLEGRPVWDALADSLVGGLVLTEARCLAMVWEDSSNMERETPTDFDIAVRILDHVATQLSNPKFTNGKIFDVHVYLA
jgi:hypothetical protein